MSQRRDDSSDASVQYPLRERRKRRTRNALINAATELFYVQGYEETTLEEVAERADVHVQTLYRHFSTKEALALAPDRMIFERFREALLDPQRSQDTLAFWRAWAESQCEEVKARFSTVYLKRARTRESVPSIAVASLRLWHEYEDVFTEALARDMAVDAATHLQPRLIACTLWGGHQHAVRRWAASDGKLDLTATVVEVIDEVIDLFGKLVRRRGRQPAAPRRKRAAARTPK